MSKFILGIDPGWSGGAAVLGFDAKAEAVYSFSKMTEADVILCIIEIISDETMRPICYIEKVHSMPKQGVASSFKFGMIYGLLRGLVISKLRVIEVTPQAWQKHLGCLTRGDKNVSKARAQQLFPGVRVTHANADALLIAYYGYLKERVYPDGTPAGYKHG